MAVVPTILPALDAIRGIGGLLGLRPFRVTVRKRCWSGGRPGAPGAIKVDLDTLLVNQAADRSLQPVLVRQVSRAEVIASGGQYASRDLRVGRMTASYLAGILAAGGYDDATVNQMPTITATELVWIIQPNDSGSHGIPAGGVIAELRGQESTALHVTVYLRATGRAPT